MTTFFMTISIEKGIPDTNYSDAAALWFCDRSHVLAEINRRPGYSDWHLATGRQAIAVAIGGQTDVGQNRQNDVRGPSRSLNG